MQNIDVVIVHYPSTKDVLECLETLEGAEARVASITVVNNAYPEQIGPEMFAGRDVNVLNRDTNDGFGTAANSGSTQGDASLILLINPDVRLDPESFSSLISLVGSYGIGLGLLLLGGLVGAGFGTTQSALVVSVVDDKIRGRAMGLL